MDETGSQKVRRCFEHTTIIVDQKKGTKETYKSCTPVGVSLIFTPRGSNS